MLKNKSLQSNVNKNNKNTIHKFSKSKQDNIDDEFKIQSNTQEYSVTKIKDLFIVQPYGSKRIDLLLKPNASVCFFMTSTDTNRSSQPSHNILQTRPSVKDESPLPIHLDSYVNWKRAKTVPLGRTETKIFKPQAFNEKSREYLYVIHEAIKLQKVFTWSDTVTRKTTGDHYRPQIKKPLTARGWIEQSLSDLPNEDVSSPKIVEYMRHILKDVPANFIWVVNSIDFSSVSSNTIVSRFPKNTHFTNKICLCYKLEQFHWFYHPNVSQTITPRTFKITSDDDINHFTTQYVITACVSLLKIVVEHIANAESDYFFRDGQVPITIVDFANTQCTEYIISNHHDDIDYKVDHKMAVEEYTEFLTWFHKLHFENEHFESTPLSKIEALYAMCKVTLKNIQPFWPQLEIEGNKNLWIVKPSNRCCGQGIIITRSLNSIINHVKEKLESKKSQNSIVQKYIENPLLIYGTKFDIRQWFLVTSVFPLVIWFYKECYLRFSSQLFSLENLHNSVHLTNNYVQQRCTNDCKRHPNLPHENMWHSVTFQNYLRNINEPEIWDTVILPGMKQGIVGAILASQDELIDRQNSFELYGADFLLGSDYTPILLEINKGPDMKPTTSVTADLCHRCLEDMMKVVLDRRKDPYAKTGQFEILYRQEKGPRHCTLGLDLTVTALKMAGGKKINRSKK